MGDVGIREIVIQLSKCGAYWRWELAVCVFNVWQDASLKKGGRRALHGLGSLRPDREQGRQGESTDRRVDGLGELRPAVG